MVGKDCYGVEELHTGPRNISRLQTMKSLGVVFKAYNSLASDVDRTIRKILCFCKCHPESCKICIRDVKIIFHRNILSTNVELVM